MWHIFVHEILFSNRSLVIPCPQMLPSMKFSTRLFLQCSPWQMNTFLCQCVAKHDYCMVWYQLDGWDTSKADGNTWVSSNGSSYHQQSECLPKELVLFHWTPKLVTCSRWFEQFHYLSIFTHSVNFRCLEVKYRHFYLPLFLFKLPVPHGGAKEDCLPRNTGDLSCKVRHLFLLINI